MTHPKVIIENLDIEKELTCKCGCGLYNYEDSFLVRWQAFRYIYGKAIDIAGGCRCIQHNHDVGGVKTSLHQGETKKAAATDVTGDCKAIYNEAIKYPKLFNEVEWHKTDGLNIVHLGYDKNQKGIHHKII